MKIVHPSTYVNIRNATTEAKRLGFDWAIWEPELIPESCGMAERIRIVGSLNSTMMQWNFDVQEWQEMKP